MYAGGRARYHPKMGNGSGVSYISKAYLTNAINFTVFERLGGTDRNPKFSTDPTSPFYVKPDAQGLYNFSMQELGIVDLPLAPVGVNIGERFIPWIWIFSPAEVEPPSATIEVVDAVTFKQMRLVAFVASGAGSDKVYYTRTVEVPQGAALRFSGWTVGDEARPIRLRIGVIPATDNHQWAAQKQAFCCLEANAGIQGVFP